MGEKRKKSFSLGVAEELDCYVYRLIDPRDGQTFYVGRGRGNRIFHHINEDEKLELNEGETSKSAKLETIREIRRAGLQPTHIVHRHKLTEDVAKEVEAVLIDIIPGLKNVLKGKGSDRGPANAEQLDRQYSKRVMDPIKNHKLLYIKINEGTLHRRGSLYEAVRGNWVVDIKKAERADYVLAVINKIVRGVFTVCKWVPSSEPRRFKFTGCEVKGSVADAYVGKLIPTEFSKQGRANPIAYGWE